MQLHAFQIPTPDDDDIDEIEIEPPAIRRLAEVKVPTLIVVGSLDLEEKLALSERLAGEIAGAQMVILPDVAHMLNMERPAQFNQAVLDFLGSL